jgi:hypothetical protein
MLRLNKFYNEVEKHHPGFTARCQAVIDAASGPRNPGNGEGPSPEKILHSPADRIFTFRDATKAAQRLTLEDCLAFAELDMLEAGYDLYGGGEYCDILGLLDAYHDRLFKTIKELAKEARLNIPMLRARLAFAIALTMQIDLIQDAAGMLPMNVSGATKVAPGSGTVLPVTGPKGKPSNYPLW